tara:strand:+ start:1289 stop:1477 length:189 start_codon:yes stop_codon:yes gene_type:complete
MEVKLSKEISDKDENIYKVKNENNAKKYVYDFYYHNAESDMIRLPKNFDGDTRLEIMKVIKK